MNSLFLCLPLPRLGSMTPTPGSSASSKVASSAARRKRTRRCRCSRELSYRMSVSVRNVVSSIAGSRVAVTEATTADSLLRAADCDQG